MLRSIIPASRTMGHAHGGFKRLRGYAAATLSSIVESVGDYIATAQVCEAPYPPHHAINR